MALSERVTRQCGPVNETITFKKEEGVCSLSPSPLSASQPLHSDGGSCVLLKEAIQLDGEILFALLKRVSPLAHRHLKKHKMDPILYMTEWFMCAFSRTLPWASVLRVWDMFLCEGEMQNVI